MIGNMTLNLFNIVSNYFGAAWSKMIMPQHPIGFGSMGVPPNLEAQNPGFL
jgi:hypothetical protein